MTESAISRFEPSTGTFAGRLESHGVAVQRWSEADRVRPGINPGANRTNAATR
jgi:hypothetical protein